MTEQWVKWEPVKGLPHQLSLEKLIDGYDGISLEFKDRDGTVTVHVLFEDFVLSYRCTERGRRFKTIDFLNETYGTDFYTTWPFFKVNHSSYMEWFHHDSYQRHGDSDIQHYVFLAENDIVDILSIYEPKVTVVQSNGS
jgi:hypothetical protein